MKALLGAFNQEKAPVGAFSVIVQPVVEPMEHYTALQQILCVEPSCARYKIVLERKREIELSIELNQQHRSSLIKLILNVKI